MRHSMASVVSRMLVFVILFAALVAVEGQNPSPALAASCPGPGCEGLDPQASGCSSAGASSPRSYPLIRQSDGVQVGVGELRYSYVCGTNWMRVTSWVGVVPMFASIGHGMNYNNTFSMHGSYQVGWTLMVYAPTPHTACGYGGISTPWTGYQEVCA